MIKDNEYWSEEKISSRLEKIENYCKEKSGRKLQKNAMPIREAVVVIKENTKMIELQNLAERLKIELGIQIFQIAIHKDEGHYDKDNAEWIPNFHAHLVADWQDKNTGKTLKHKSYHYSLMQDLTAECLGMERGIQGKNKRLEAIEYKLKNKEESYQNLVNKIMKTTSNFSSEKPMNLIVKDKNRLGEDEINFDKTIEKFEIALKVFKAKIDLSEQNIEAKNKKISRYENQILDLIKEVRKYKREQYQFISNPDFLEKKRSEIESSILNLIENELKYEIQKRPNSNWDSKEFILDELPAICEKLARENDIPNSYFNSVFYKNESKQKILNIINTISDDSKMKYNL